MSSESKSQGEQPAPVAYPKVFLYNGALYEFDPHRVVYSEPGPAQGKGFVIKCTYPITVVAANGSKINVMAPLNIQTPVMETTFGFSTFVAKDGKTTASVDATYSGAAPDEVAFHEVMMLFDKLVLAKAKDNKQWFKTKMVSDEILDFLYNPMTRVNMSKDGTKQYPDSFRSKIKRSADGSWVCEVYDITGAPIIVEDITQKCMLRKQCTQTGIWFTDTGFTSSFHATQVQVVAPGHVQGYAMVGTVGDEEETVPVDEPAAGVGMVD
jgi:hypothetical protein